jgi:hypothetical protein
MESSATEYVSRGFGITGYKFVFEAQVAHQLPYRPRKTGALRPGLEQKAISPDCANQAAGVFRSFQEARAAPQLLQAMSTSEARDSRADHYDLFCVSHGKQNLSNV